MSVLRNIHHILAYFTSFPKALSAAHPDIRLAIEQTSTGFTIQNFKLNTEVRKKDYYVPKFFSEVHQNANLITDDSNSSNNDSLNSSFLDELKLMRFAVCTKESSLVYFQYAVWWFFRPVLYNDTRQVLPLSLSLTFHQEASEADLSSFRELRLPWMCMLTLNNSQIEWLSLAHLASLQFLKLVQCPSQKKLSKIECSTHLKTIVLDKLNYLTSIDSLSACTQLEILHIKQCRRLSNVAVISNLPRLWNIDLSELLITELVPESLHSRSLDETCTDDALADAGDVSSLFTEDGRSHGGLHNVILSDCPNLMNINFLRHHHCIRFLFVARLPICDMKWFNCHAHIEDLTLHRNAKLILNHDAWLHHRLMHYITRLSVQAVHSQSNFDWILQCSRVHTLNLSNWHQPMDWTVLSQLRFTTLVLSFNSSITDLTWLSKCTQLTSLFFTYHLNPMDFSSIGRLNRLVKLDLSATIISDDHLATIVAGCPLLQHITLNECANIANVQFLSQLRELCYFSASETFIRSIEWMKQCPKLRSVTLYNCNCDKSILKELRLDTINI